MRFIVAAGSLLMTFLLLGLTVLVPGDHAALITGLLAAMTGVLGFYFGGHGAAAAQRVAVQATEERTETRRVAEESLALLEDARQAARRYEILIKAAESDPDLDKRIKQALVGIRGDERDR